MNIASIIYDIIGQTTARAKVQTQQEFEEAKKIRKSVLIEPFKSMGQ